MLKSALCLFLTTTLMGCAVSPYINRTVPDSNGIEIKYEFAYGKFCGPGYPTLKENEKLENFWPPVDDLDAICYAHDKCYDLTFVDSAACDGAFYGTLLHFATRYNKSGCFLIHLDLLDAFALKTYSKTETEFGTFTHQTSRLIISPLFVLVGKIIAIPYQILAKSAEEGECSVGPKPSPLPVFEVFQKEYKEDAIRYKQPTIVIPFPG